MCKIMQHLPEHDILAESQHGFRSGRSCETHLLQFIHDLRGNLDGAIIEVTSKQTSILWTLPKLSIRCHNED